MEPMETKLEKYLNEAVFGNEVLPDYEGFDIRRWRGKEYVAFTKGYNPQRVAVVVDTGKEKEDLAYLYSIINARKKNKQKMKYMNKNFVEPSISSMADKYAENISNIKNRYFDEMQNIFDKTVEDIENQLRTLRDESEKIATKVGSFSKAEVTHVENAILSALGGRNFEDIFYNIDKKLLDFDNMEE